MKIITITSTLLIVLVTACSNNGGTNPIPTSSSTPTSETTSPPSPPKTEYDIRKEAKNVTVQIDGKVQGSGLIIKRDRNKYYVLTSKHVVGIEPGQNIEIPSPLPDEQNLSNQEDPYQVIAPDGKNYKIEYSNVQKDSNLDLALIEFTTSRDYSVANLAIPLSKQQQVYIYGFKACTSDKNENKPEFNSGTISSINTKNLEEGYGVNYTNPTITGMSGSPVFDELGRVVAIHGKPGRKGKDREYRFDKCSSLTSDYGNNSGISMENFSNSKLASGRRLEFDQTAIGNGSSSSEIKDNKQPNNESDSEIRFKKAKP